MGVGEISGANIGGEIGVDAAREGGGIGAIDGVYGGRIGRVARDRVEGGVGDDGVDVREVKEVLDDEMVGYGGARGDLGDVGGELRVKGFLEILGCFHAYACLKKPKGLGWGKRVARKYRGVGDRECDKLWFRVEREREN